MGQKKGKKTMTFVMKDLYCQFGNVNLYKLDSANISINFGVKRLFMERKEILIQICALCVLNLNRFT